MRTRIGQQGECIITKIDKLPNGIETKPAEIIDGKIVISHSESGHHHYLTGGDVMERTNDVPAGLQIFYAILDAPEKFKQDAGNAHGEYDLEAGVYEFRNSREYDPFAEQARRVAD